jgi:hypothetical protein
MQDFMGLLSHFDLAPLVYGLFMFLGIAVIWHKLVTFRWPSLAIDIGVFWLVFSMHGGSMTGGFAAMICAALAGILLPLWFRGA